MKHIAKTIMTLALALSLLSLASCGAAGLAELGAQLNSQLGSVDDDGTPDQGRGDFPGTGSSGGSTDDDGTPDQGSGDFPGTGGSNGSTDDDGTPDQGRGDRGDDRNDDDSRGRGSDDD